MGDNETASRFAGLAAARVRLCPPEALLARLEKRHDYAYTFVTAPDAPWEADGLQREIFARLTVEENLLSVFETMNLPLSERAQAPLAAALLSLSQIALDQPAVAQLRLTLALDERAQLHRIGDASVEVDPTPPLEQAPDAGRCRGDLLARLGQALRLDVVLALAGPVEDSSAARQLEQVVRAHAAASSVKAARYTTTSQPNAAVKSVLCPPSEWPIAANRPRCT